MDVIFRGYDAYGDYLSNNGMIRYLSSIYDTVKVVTVFGSYVNYMFRDNSKISSINLTEFDHITSINNNYDIVDAFVWENYIKPSRCNGTLYNKHNKLGKFENSPINDNASAFYYHLGLDVNMRLNNFFLQRDFNNEYELYNIIKDKNYSVICEYNNCSINRKYVINNNIVNIHKMSENICNLIKIIEEANEVHLVENSIALLVYHMQYKKLMKDVKINLHAYSRKESHRICNGPNCNNFYLNMLLYPKLDNWEFIYE